MFSQVLPDKRNLPIIPMLSLHVHSNYSLLKGTIPIDDLINFAKVNESTYVALADTNGMYGLIQLRRKQKK